MKAGIFLIQDNGQLIEMNEQKYDSEDLLQELLAKYPNLLAGDQIDTKSPRRWLLITREASIPSEDNGGGRWSVDHLFLDQDAVPTLVEVKRSSDTRIRREVVGQMLDYAANAIAFWPVESVIAKFEAKCEIDGIDPEQVLENFIEDGANRQEFWQKVKTNLQAGKVRLVFVSDEIPSELRRIVEFLNTQMDPAEVLAVEISQYVAKGLRTLVPRVMGQTEEAQRKKASGTRISKQWDEPMFLARLSSSNLDEERIESIKKLLEEAKRIQADGRILISWGTGKDTGSFTVKRKGNSCISIFSNAGIWLNMGGWKTLSLENKSILTEQLGKKLAIDLKYADHSYPNIGEKVFSADDGITKLIEWLESAIQLMD